MNITPVLEDFKIVKKLGHGSFGVVWLVQHTDSKLSVMKKISLLNLSQDDVEKAKQEVFILSSLDHPNIVSYKGSVETGDSLYILMGYCEGGDLRQAIQGQNGCLFPEQQVIRWFIQIVMALLYLHQRNILHRDLKTQNLFLTKCGLVKVGDFGISRHLDSTDDMASTVVGTPFYMSPEILAGLPYNQKSDVWSLGCCLFELLTLRHPFQAKDIGSLVFRVTRGKIGRIPHCYSEEMSSLVQSLLHHKAQERPSPSALLRMPFIRSHMETFLSDTKRMETKNRRGKTSRSSSRRPRPSEETENVLPKDVDKKNQVHKKSNEVKVRPNEVNKKSSEVSKKPSEVNMKSNEVNVRSNEVINTLGSLFISGGKMKLENKTRTEVGTGIRSCNCVRHARGEGGEGTPPTQSPHRRRVKSNEVIVEEEDCQLLECSQSSLLCLDSSTQSSVFDLSSSETSLLGSARERRRREKRHSHSTFGEEPEVFLCAAPFEEDFSSSGGTENVEEPEVSLCAASSEEDFSSSGGTENVEEPKVPLCAASFEEDFSLSGAAKNAAGGDEADLVHGESSRRRKVELGRQREFNSFSVCLNRTILTESEETEKPDDDDVCADSPVSLDDRMRELRKSLTDNIGVEAMFEVETILNEGSWHHQKLKLECFLGKDVFEGLSLLIWKIKLCHELLS